MEANKKYALVNSSGKPETVANLERFLSQHGFWYMLSRNPPVTSCQDAANRRQRLGKTGIPLRDELRSYVLSATDNTGNPVYVALHCRADRNFDLNRLPHSVPVRRESIKKSNLADDSSGDLAYGTVNPFNLDALSEKGTKVLQVFDTSLSDTPGVTGTMMTNAGDHSWALEFDPMQLLESASNKGWTIAEVTSAFHTSFTRPKNLGILTGNSPESGALLWKKINECVRQRLGVKFKGDISYPRVFISSVPEMGLTMELATRHRYIKDMVMAEIDGLVARGAECIAIACNTTQHFSPQIKERLETKGVDYVVLSDAIESWIDELQDQSVYVAGIDYVTDKDGWSAYSDALKRSNVHSPDESQTEVIHDLAYQVKNVGVNGKTYQKFRAVVRRANAVYTLLLLTELSQIFDVYNRPLINGSNIIDGIDLYAKKIASRLF